MTHDQAATRTRWAPSPVFLALVAVAAVSGWALWNLVGVDRSAADGGIVVGLITFVFVAASWVITLCLHEFGHAIVAYRNGDLSVAHRGYLTLDPLRYTHALFSIVLPAAAPKIFAGLRIASTAALLLAIVSEFILASNGIGFQLIQAQGRFQLLNMWSWMLALAILGLLINFLLDAVENRVLSWHKLSRQKI